MLEPTVRHAPITLEVRVTLHGLHHMKLGSLHTHRNDALEPCMG